MDRPADPPRALTVLRELESNAFAMLLAVLIFLLLLFVVAIVASAIWGIDWNAVFGIGGMGTGSGMNGHLSQAMSNRSPNYQPLVANPGAGPVGLGMPSGSSLPMPGIRPPGPPPTQ